MTLNPADIIWQAEITSSHQAWDLILDKILKQLVEVGPSFLTDEYELNVWKTCLRGTLQPRDIIHAGHMYLCPALESIYNIYSSFLFASLNIARMLAHVWVTSASEPGHGTFSCPAGSVRSQLCACSQAKLNGTLICAAEWVTMKKLY